MLPTAGERLIRAHALGRLNRLKKLRAEKMKKTSADRTPMLSQVGEVLKRSGYEHEKPADIIKRVIAKGKVLPEQTSKLSGGAPPTSSHHQLGVRRDRPKLEIGQDDTNPKLAGHIGRAIAGASKPMYSGQDISRALGSDPSTGWEKLTEQHAREMLKHALLGAAAGVGARFLGGLGRVVARVAGPKAGLATVRAGRSVGRFAARRPITTGATGASFLAPSKGPQMPSMMPMTPMGAR